MRIPIPPGVTLMGESMISLETWTFECAGCLHEWREDFEVGHAADGHGGAVVYYRRDGHPCTSPWSERCCPSCGGYDVKIVPHASVRARPRPSRRYAELELVFRLRRLHAY